MAQKRFNIKKRITDTEISTITGFVFKFSSGSQRDINTLLANQIFAPTKELMNDPFEGVFSEDGLAFDVRSEDPNISVDELYEKYVNPFREEVKDNGI